MLLRTALQAIIGLGLAQACLPLAYSQEFEVASIKPAPPSSDGRTHTRWSVTIGERGEPGRLLYANVSVKEVISKAYQVQEYQIVAPDWASSERFDINAIIPADAKSDQVP